MTRDWIERGLGKMREHEERLRPFPKVRLECRPGYETHVVYCNMARRSHQDDDPHEIAFTLAMIVDDSDRIVLRHETTAFSRVGDVVEFLLGPVLFPALEPD
jgi:hypothetical protein